MKTSLWKNYSKKQLQEKINQSKTKKDFMIALGYKEYRSNTMRDIENFYPDLNWSKFTNGIFQNLVGQSFGRLTVLERDTSKTDQVWWKCRCSCGNIISVRAYALKDKKQPVQSCGCLLKEARYNKIKDLSGQKFGHLTVIERDRENLDKQRVRYICECDCDAHTRISVLADNLKRGHSTSCGCINSKGEDKINIILKELGLSYKRECSFSDLLNSKGNQLRFDFVIFNQQNIPTIAIECQGIQHYQPVQIFGGQEKFQQQLEHDNLKRQYCEKHNISLIEIPYTDYDKLNTGYILQYLNNI